MGGVILRIADRSMRGYKRPQSILNVSRLIGWAGKWLDTDGADLAEVVA
jgi:hypothetical protein